MVRSRGRVFRALTVDTFRTFNRLFVVFLLLMGDLVWIHHYTSVDTLVRVLTSLAASCIWVP